MRILTRFYPKYSFAVAVTMAAKMYSDKSDVDFILVLHHNIYRRKVSTKSVTMHVTALCKYLKSL